ncbi:antibiotic biosynthesis monooxygenase [Streptosporangium sp. NPDC051023]|uniref:putative quinol monooxygenase n=1 Tax=Streptosporangium sp. NPDC051023 TaxID=3155410 RepID=UPI00344E05EA
MNLLVAVIAFAGALLAAIATIALVSRLRDERKGWLIAWSITTTTLCVSLGVIGTGCLIGFGATTFRIYQLTGSLLAPLWLAVGVVQLVGRKSAARFASWLLGIAFTIVGLVIMISDRVDLVQEFTTSLPVGSRHWDVFPAYLLWVTHAGAALTLLGGLVFAVLRWRGGDDYDADNMHALLVLGPTGLAALGAVSFAVPGMFTILLLSVTVAAIWYVVLRPLAPYEDEDEETGAEARSDSRPAPRRAAPAQPFQDVQVAGRRAAPQEQQAGRALPEDSSRRSGLGDLVAEYRAGEQDVDYAARMRQGPPAQDDPFGGPATGMFMAGEYGMPPAGGQQGRPPGADYASQPPVTGQFGMTSGGFATGEYDIPANEYGRHAGPGAQHGRPPAQGIGEYGRPGGPVTGEFAMPDPAYGGQRDGSLSPMPADQAFGGPAMPGGPAAFPPGGQTPPQGLGGASRHAQLPDWGQASQSGHGQPPAGVPGFPAYGGPQGAPPETGALYPGAIAEQAGGSNRPSPSIYGLLTVFTLLDGTGEMFDRLAEETLEAVRRAEPDTLIYACHSVKSAPLQRIVYELYRDEVAYTDHQRQPHVERFVTERQNMVLATNVIELNVNAAKVVPLPMVFGI